MSRSPIIVVAALLAAIGRLSLPAVHAARWAMLLLMAMLLTACAQQPMPPESSPPPAPIVCAAPVGMTGPEPEPDRPQGEVTQRDVALYVTDLHGWGKQGWKQLAAVRRHASQCIDEHTSNEPRE